MLIHINIILEGPLFPFLSKVLLATKNFYGTTSNTIFQVGAIITLNIPELLTSRSENSECLEKIHWRYNKQEVKVYVGRETS